MKIPIKPIKTTLIGGIVFLIPLAICLAVTGKLFLLTSKLVAPLSALIPVDSIGGIAIAKLMTVIVILVFCFLAGLIARSTLGRKIFTSLESKLYVFVPRYAFVKSMTASLSGDNNDLKGLTPVRVNFDDYTQIAFEVERTTEGMVTIYLPGAPDVWSGIIIHVNQDQVERLDTDFITVIQSLRKVGVGSGKLMTSSRKQNHKDTID